MKPKFLRKRDNPQPWHATDMLLERSDLYPCDEQGRFLSTNEYELPEAKPTPDGPVNDMDAKRLESLREHARSLKLRGWNNAKEEKLTEMIAKAEAALREKSPPAMPVIEKTTKKDK